MFTGIIEEMGTVLSSGMKHNVLLWDDSKGDVFELKIECSKVLEGAYIGCSIAVNGVCLTVTEFDDTTFVVQCSDETIHRTNLGTLVNGNKVNLESAASMNHGKNSGHYVQGHVDCTATIMSKRNDQNSLWIKLHLDDNYIKYIVPKGFVAIDGTSLTVVDVNYTEQSFTFMLIPHTQEKIIIPMKQIGEKVNIEVDSFGKYAISYVENIEKRLSTFEERIDNLFNSLEKRITNIEKNMTTMEKTNLL